MFYLFKISKCAILISLLAACSTQSKISKQPIKPLFEDKLIPKIQDTSNPIYYNLKDRMSFYNIPGLSVLTIKNGEIDLEKQYGFARVKEKIRVSPATVFHAGSISKSITALIVMKLRDEGQINLDTDINQYLKSWKLPQNSFTKQSPVTPRTLLNHTSGIKTINSKGFIEGEELPTLNEYLDGLSKAPPITIDTIPGAVYAYSTRGYSILELMIEDLKGNKFEQIAKNMIFDPLKMSESTFATVFPEDKNYKYCYSYDKEGNPNKGYWNYTVQIAGGGLKTTASDLAKLCIAIRHSLVSNNGFIKRESAQEMMIGKKYGLGFDLKKSNGVLSFSHSGRVPGFFAYMIMYPKSGDGLVLLTNSDNGGALFQEILMGFSELNSWNLMNPKRIQSIEISEELKNKYIGNYELKLGSEIYEIQIQKIGKDLYYKMKNEDEMFPLKALSKTKFIDIIEGEEFEFIDIQEKALKVISNSEYEFSRKKN